VFSKILVPVDLAEPGMIEPALDEAVEIAERSGADIRLLNVQSPAIIPFMGEVLPDFENQVRLAIEPELTNIVAKIEYEHERLSTALRFGTVYHEALAEADEWGADLIVISSHRPSMGAYLMGSNAQKIVRHAKCSVLVVRR
jgi:nucleotide-binding universal stress UspA family protein